MKRLLWFVIALIFVGMIALLDIAVVELILNRAGITEQYVRIWHIAMFGVFMPILFVVLWLFLNQLPVAVWMAGLTIGGWEDALYFWLQGKAVPAALPWHPYLQTDIAVYVAMAASFLILWTITPRTFK